MTGAMSLRNMPTPTLDAVIVGGGHNGLVAATLLARAGWSVRILERGSEVGGAAVSAKLFPGVDARVSRYAYLVSLFPQVLRDELELRTEFRPRRGADTRSAELIAWQDRMRRLAVRIAPTLTEPLMAREELRALIDDEQLWEDVFERPLSVALERDLTSDAERGVVLTDGLIGTFASAADEELRQNRCFLYHVIGDGHGEWRVPVGGMGALTAELESAARAAGVEIELGREVVAVDSDGTEAEVIDADGSRCKARHVLLNAALGFLSEPHDRPPEGAQLKINMLLSRLPRLRDSDLDPELAFTGTFHVNEGYEQLEAAYAVAATGRIPELPPCEMYCHSLTDPTILSPELRAAGAHTLTLFGLHMPARLFRRIHDTAKRQAVAATLRSVDSVLAEPLAGCLWRDGDGRPCLEAVTPLELQAELGMPGGHIFHHDLSWPFAEDAADVGRWGVETEVPNLWLCGAGARRGGGVSGIPGHNAARAVLAAG